MKKTLFAALLMTAFNVLAGDAVQVFGLSLGGKLSIQVKACPFNTDKAKVICWVGKPYVATGGDRLGSIHLPNPDARPAWAAYAMFKMHIAKDGEIKALNVRTINAEDKHAIATSISNRFGLPFETTLPRNDVSWATWRNKDVYIQMACSDQCFIDFRSASLQAEVERETSERKRKESARPLSP